MNGAYQVDVPSSVREAISRLPKERQRQIQARIDSLGENPHPHGCVKLTGHENRGVSVSARIALSMRFTLRDASSSSLF